MRPPFSWLLSTRRRRWITLGVVMFVIMPVVSVELTSQSWFCNSCHIMNSYYASWKTGSHSKVECVSCHIPPGPTNFISAKLNGAGQVVDDLLNRTSTKPSAAVSDFSCTRSGCHDIGKVRNISRREGKFFFNHAKHLDLEYIGLNLHCTSCHSHVSGSKHFEVNTNVCITCHLMTPGSSEPVVRLTGIKTATSADLPGDEFPTTEPASHDKLPPNQCKSCHDAPKKEIEYQGLKVLHSDYLAYGAACESCHRGVTSALRKMDNDMCFSCHDFGMERATSTKDMHHVHSNGRHKVECFSCHGVLRHGPSAQSMQLAQIQCQSCHHKQHEIQQMTYKRVELTPHQPADPAAVSPMFLAHVACTACHVQDRPLKAKAQTGATVAAASAKACDNCHQPGLGERLVPLWQKNAHDQYDAVAKLLPSDTASLPASAKPLVAQARGILDLVRLDGSWGAHNPRYTQKLLLEAQQKLVAIQSLTQGNPAPANASRQ